MVSNRDSEMYKDWTVSHKELLYYCKQPPCPLLQGMESLSSTPHIKAVCAPLERV